MIAIRWIKLHSESPDKAPRLQFNEQVDDPQGKWWTGWQTVPLRFVHTETQTDGDNHSERYGD